MSACHSSPSAAVTVRQTPFTATLSPGVNSRDSAVRMRTPYPAGTAAMSLTWPTVSMRPVNIAFDQHIRTELLHSPLDQRRRREFTSLEQRDSILPQPHRGNIELDVVNDSGVPSCGMHRRATFQEHAVNALDRQVFKPIGQFVRRYYQDRSRR